MKKYIYSTWLLFLISVSLFGQAPNWSVNENNFQYTMTFVSFLNVDGRTLANPNDKVAAFVNGECRGVTNLIYVASEGRYYAYLTVFANTINEAVDFKIYDAGASVIKSVNKTVLFKISEHQGNVFQAYSFASPVLSLQSEISRFGFSGVTINDIIVEGSQITLYLDRNADIETLKATFELSSGAQLFLGNIKQVSGISSLNYTNPIQFQVMSEDQSIIKQWSIVVKVGLGTGTYYKKDAVCYEGGSIKVLFTKNEVEAVLYLNGIIHSTQTINNGETIFKNLPVGTYTVKVGDTVKVIKINLKQ
jgi:hypothetical protein